MTARATSLTEDLLKQVRQIQIRTGRAVTEVFAGQFSSAFRGRGMEFAEVRAYQPGDEIRTIDWNVTARTGEPFIKRFTEERELTVFFVVDLSASGDFGSLRRTKNQVAAELCALLAFAAARSNDKTGLLIFTDEVELFVPARKGSRHVLRLIREVLAFDPARTGTNATGAIRHLRSVLHRRAVIFLISDYLFPDAGAPRGVRTEFETALRSLARRHDVIAARIIDRRESELPGMGLVELHDAESGRSTLIDTSSRRVREIFRANAARRTRGIEQQMRRLRIDFVDIEAGESYVPALVRLFHRREKRR